MDVCQHFRLLWQRPSHIKLVTLCITPKIPLQLWHHIFDGIFVINKYFVSTVFISRLLDSKGFSDDLKVRLAHVYSHVIGSLLELPKLTSLFAVVVNFLKGEAQSLL